MRLGNGLARFLRGALGEPPRPKPVAPGPLPAESTRYFYLGPDVALTRLRDGHYLFVDPQDETVTAHLIGRGFWETWIQQAIFDALRPGDRVIEVGSNAGSHTMAMALRVGETGHVTAVEANPRMAALLKRSIEYNGYAGRIDLHHGVANDREGSVAFMMSRRNGGGGHTLVYENIFGADSITIDVPAVRLDVLVAEPADFIRLDAEGSEPQVLAGAARHLENPDILLCMEWDVFQMSMRTSVPEFIDGLTGRGFHFWRIETDGGLTALPDEGMAELPHCEVFVCRNHPRNGRRSTRDAAEG
jgi:FkbM family methyltransferase